MTQNSDEGEEDEVLPFEMVVLDVALDVTLKKFQQNLSSMKPLFALLLELTLSNPSDMTLEKLFALKKSLLSFETRYFIYVNIIGRVVNFTICEMVQLGR